MLTHYDVLGVNRNASPASIRAVYLNQIKQLHPDRPGIHTHVGSPSAAELNVAYSVLRDSQKRAKYDRELARTQARAQFAAALLRAETLSQSPGSGTSWKGIFVVCALSGILLLSLDTNSIAPVLRDVSVLRDLPLDRLVSVPNARFQEHMASFGMVSPEVTADKQRIDVASAVSAALAVQSSEAERASRQCFDDLEKDGRAQPRELDHCIAFDITAGIWYSTLRASSPNSYFGIDSQAKRHLAALRGNGESAPRNAARYYAIELQTRSHLSQRPAGEAGGDKEQLGNR